MNEDSAEFFYDPEITKLSTFPLLQMAIRFFDHPDNLIKTSTRTIIL